MILIDVNLLIYAVNSDAPLHRAAKSWLEAALSGPETVGLSWSVLLAFLRLTTRSGLFQKPLPVKAAFDLLDSWLAQPSVVTVEPTTQHIRVLRRLLLPSGTAGNLTSDAHLPPSPSSTEPNSAPPTTTSPGFQDSAGAIPCRE